jgi:CRISPR-associated protein Cpf1
LLIENQVFPKDKIVYESYKKIRPYLDKLHLQFIEESLSSVKLDFNEIEKKFLEWDKEKDKTTKNKLKEEIF